MYSDLSRTFLCLSPRQQKHVPMSGDVNRILKVLHGFQNDSHVVNTVNPKPSPSLPEMGGRNHPNWGWGECYIYVYILYCFIVYHATVFNQSILVVTPKQNIDGRYDSMRFVDGELGHVPNPNRSQKGLQMVTVCYSYSFWIPTISLFRAMLRSSLQLSSDMMGFPLQYAMLASMNLLDLDHLPFIFRCNDDGNPLNTMMGT